MTAGAVVATIRAWGLRRYVARHLTYDPFLPGVRYTGRVTDEIVDMLRREWSMDHGLVNVGAHWPPVAPAPPSPPPPPRGHG